MVRPCNKKVINRNADYTCFKPAGIVRDKLEKVEISAEEFEAYRLSNFDLLSNQKGANRINTSSSTFNRLVKSAESKIADGLVNGKGIKIFRIDGTHNCK